MRDDIQDYNLYGLQKDRHITAGLAKTLLKERKVRQIQCKLLEKTTTFHMLSQKIKNK